MVIFHDAMQKILNVVFVFFEKITNPVSFKKTTKNRIKK